MSLSTLRCYNYSYSFYLLFPLILKTTVLCHFLEVGRRLSPGTELRSEDLRVDTGCPELLQTEDIPLMGCMRAEVQLWLSEPALYPGWP